MKYNFEILKNKRNIVLVGDYESITRNGRRWAKRNKCPLYFCRCLGGARVSIDPPKKYNIFKPSGFLKSNRS